MRIRGVPPEAVGEMAPRLQSLYAQWLEEGRGVDIHTIHGWANRMLVRHAFASGRSMSEAAEADLQRLLLFFARRKGGGMERGHPGERRLR